MIPCPNPEFVSLLRNQYSDNRSRQNYCPPNSEYELNRLATYFIVLIDQNRFLMNLGAIVESATWGVLKDDYITGRVKLVL